MKTRKCLDRFTIDYVIREINRRGGINTHEALKKLEADLIGLCEDRERD